MANEVRRIARDVGPENLIYTDLIPDGLIDYSVNSVEKVLYNGDRTKGLKALISGYVAAQKTEERFVGAWGVGGESDAYRHATWGGIFGF